MPWVHEIRTFDLVSPKKPKNHTDMDKFRYAIYWTGGYVFEEGVDKEHTKSTECPVATAFLKSYLLHSLDSCS